MKNKKEALVKKRHIYLILMGILIVTSVAGCNPENNTTDTDRSNSGVSQKKTDDSSGKLIEPCELITKTEAEEIMGEALKEGAYSEQQAVGLKMCLYEAVNEDSARLLNIALTQTAFMSKESLASGQSPQTIFDAIKENFSETRIDVEGIGTEAFLATPGLHILQGDYYISIGAGNLEKNKEWLKTAGKKAVQKLRDLDGRF